MKNTYLIGAILFAILVVSGALVHRVRAQVSLPAAPGVSSWGVFGGPVQAVVPCGCSGNWRVFIGPPVGGIFIYNNTPQYPFSQLPRAHIWTLGLYTPGGVCRDGHDCDSISSGAIKGTITNIVGTSMTL